MSSLEYVISLPNQGQTASEMKSSVLLHFLHPKTKAHILYLRSTPIIGLILQLQQPLSMLGTTNKVQETGRWKKLSKARVSLGTKTCCLPKLGSNTQLLLCARQRQAWGKSIHIRTIRVLFKLGFSGLTLEPDPRDWTRRLLIISFAAWMEASNYCSCLISTTPSPALCLGHVTK